ncbi:MAG TPA: hypothetical protein VFJ74_02590 [Gemmatimonadaceae bacterium]|nr:hypothetical protein [Gemmatimonadaceae bacterium]
MPDRHELFAALDGALRVVERAIASEMHTRDGEPARSRLERLRVELVTERQAAMAPGGGGALDREWVARTVRAVAEWAPDDEVQLIAALGRIARVVAS